MSDLTDTYQDEQFASEYTQARQTGGMEWAARVLSGRLRQMDKRAKAANVRADNAEAAMRIMKMRAEAAECRLAEILQSQGDSHG